MIYAVLFPTRIRTFFLDAASATREILCMYGVLRVEYSNTSYMRQVSQGTLFEQLVQLMQDDDEMRCIGKKKGIV